jgi:hypothetical protein
MPADTCFHGPLTDPASHGPWQQVKVHVGLINVNNHISRVPTTDNLPGDIMSESAAQSECFVPCE